MTYSMTAVDIKNILISSDDCDPQQPGIPDLSVDFTTSSPDIIQMPGRWKVNLGELFIAGAIKNINTPMKIDVQMTLYGGAGHEVNNNWKVQRELKPGVFGSFEDLITEIMSLFNLSFYNKQLSLSDVITINFNKQKNKIQVQKKHPKNFPGFICNEVRITVTNELRHILGFGQHDTVTVQDNKKHELPNVADLFRGVYKIYIMCNIISSQNVGKGKYELLRMVPINYKDMVERHMFHYIGDPWFCDVNTVDHTLPSIRIKLIEDVQSEEYINLEHGSSVSLTLQFIRYA